MNQNNEYSSIKKEGYFQDLIENFGDAITIINSKGKILFQNNSALKMIDSNKTSKIGELFFENIHPDEKEKVEKFLSNLVVNYINVKDFSTRIVDKNGVIFYVEGTAKNLINSVKMNEIVLNYRNVTQRIYTDETQRKRENYLKALQKLSSISADENFEYLLTKIVEIMAEVSDSNRVYIFKKQTENEGVIIAKHQSRVVEDRLMFQRLNSHLAKTSCEYWISRFRNILLNEEVLNFTDNQFPKSVKLSLTTQKIQSILIIPILLKNELWGILCFDNCEDAKVWQSLDIEYLKAGVNILELELKRMANLDSILKSYKMAESYEFHKGEEQSKELENFISICASCNSFRDDKNGSKWISPSEYISKRLPEVKFSHGYCLDCVKKLFPEYYDEVKKKLNESENKKKNEKKIG